MTAKKTRPNTRRKAPTSKTPLWAWVVIAVQSALLVALVLYIINLPKPTTAPLSSKATTKENKPPQPRFDFYEILKEQRIEVPDRSDEVIATIPSDTIYYLQAGSFRSAEDADRLRVKLILQNLETTVESATREGKTWHRVIVGPFTSRSKMASARSTLASSNLNPLLLKRTVE